jgi:hypothetical protein
MKLNRLIAIPALALAAGLSLAACGGGSGSSGGGSTTTTTTPKATACADWTQAKTEHTTAEGNADIQRAVDALGSSASAAGSNASLWQALYMVSISAQTGSSAGVSVYSAAINRDCGSNGSAPAATQAPAPTQAPAATQAPVTQAPAPTQAPAAQSDAWSTAVAYTNDVNAGDHASAWNTLSSSVQSHGWGGSYNTYVADFTPLSFDNVTYSSSSGDSVTFTFTLHNHSTGSESFTTCTFTVDNGVITSST